MWSGDLSESSIRISDLSTATQTIAGHTSCVSVPGVRHGTRYFEMHLDQCRGCVSLGWMFVPDPAKETGSEHDGSTKAELMSSARSFLNVTKPCGSHKNSWAIDTLGTFGHDNQWIRIRKKIKAGNCMGISIDTSNGHMQFFVNGEKEYEVMDIALTDEQIQRGTWYAVASLKYKGTITTGRWSEEDQEYCPIGQLPMYPPLEKDEIV